MGVLANHVPSIEQLKAGLLEIFTEGGNKEEYFVAGGFAIVQPGSKLSINAVEAYKIDEFSKEVCKNNIETTATGLTSAGCYFKLTRGSKNCLGKRLGGGHCRGQDPNRGMLIGLL